MIGAKIVADSVSRAGHRITTMQLIYPRFIHAEFMTHRVFSRNASSSRAIPVKRILEMLRDTPAMPFEWGLNQPGMQASKVAGPELQAKGERIWLGAMDHAVSAAQALADLGFHKQIVNRVTEPFAHIAVIVTATDWDNFFALRRHPDAQPEIHELADRMFEVMEASSPTLLEQDGPQSWHLPYVSADDWKKIKSWSHMQFATQPTQCEVDYVDVDNMTEHHVLLVSAARCARVSYLNHDGTDPDLEKDIGLAGDLSSSQHWSPFEHQAMPCATGCHEHHANFRGWVSHRMITEAHEHQKVERAVMDRVRTQVFAALGIEVVDPLGRSTGTIQ